MRVSEIPKEKPKGKKIANQIFFFFNLNGIKDVKVDHFKAKSAASGAEDFDRLRAKLCPPCSMICSERLQGLSGHPECNSIAQCCL